MHIFQMLFLNFNNYLKEINDISKDKKKGIDIMDVTRILNLTEDENKAIVHLSNKYNEMELLNNLAITLDGKCDWYSLSWNIYSYL